MSYKALDLVDGKEYILAMGWGDSSSPSRHVRGVVKLEESTDLSQCFGVRSQYGFSYFWNVPSNRQDIGERILFAVEVPGQNCVLYH